jgi:hypothetical protein
MGMAEGRSLLSLTLSCSRNFAASEEAANSNSEFIMRISQIGTISVAPLWGQLQSRTLQVRILYKRRLKTCGGSHRAQA